MFVPLLSACHTMTKRVCSWRDDCLKKAAGMPFKHAVVVVPGARRARLDRRGAAREGLAAAASSAAGGNTSAIAELLAVAQLWAADGGCPERRFSSRRGPLLEKFTIAFPGTRLSGSGVYLGHIASTRAP